MSRPLLAVSLMALLLSGCASRMAFPDEVEAWGYEPPTLTR
jgi:PBP1b-binding outer membrane lipoprotein LpoB